MAKKPAKKTPAKQTAAARKALRLELTATQLKKAKACLERSGKVTFGFKEISVTKLPKSIGPIAVFMD
jgi:hypothetical protein